jgi:hypothetical protein
MVSKGSLPSIQNNIPPKNIVKPTAKIGIMADIIGLCFVLGTSLII